MEIIGQATSDLIMAGASSNYICSMVHGRLQRNYHVCIRRITDHRRIGRANRDHRHISHANRDYRHIGRANMRWHNIMTGGLLDTAVLRNEIIGQNDTPQNFFRLPWIRIVTALPVFLLPH